MSIFQKAIQEARSFLEDGSLSEGMTLKPLDPVEEDQVSSTTETQSQKTKKVGHLFQVIQLVVNST